MPDLEIVRVERVTRIELALSAWEADVLPLNYTRVLAHASPHLSGSRPTCPDMLPDAWHLPMPLHRDQRELIRQPPDHGR
jgi:hypothetical protein